MPGGGGNAEAWVGGENWHREKVWGRAMQEERGPLAFLPPSLHSHRLFLQIIMIYFMTITGTN